MADLFGCRARFRLSGTVLDYIEVIGPVPEHVDEVGAVMRVYVLGTLVGAFAWLSEGEVGCGNGMG